MTHDESCPLCTRAMDGLHQIEVCQSCHSGLQLSGALPVTITGEFAAVMMPPPEAPGQSTGTAPASTKSCSWCGKEAEAVRKLLSQGSYHICNECVALCADILRMELGDDFG